MIQMLPDAVKKNILGSNEDSSPVETAEPVKVMSKIDKYEVANDYFAKTLKSCPQCGKNQQFPKILHGCSYLASKEKY